MPKSQPAWKSCTHNGGEHLHFIDLGFLMVDVLRDNDESQWEVQVVEGCGSIDSVVALPHKFDELADAKKEGIALARKLLRRASRQLSKATREL